MKKNGFTIIEVIIAIFILSIAVIGVYSAFSVMVILTNNASDRLTGAYLAQEGVEVIRNIRDSNWLDMDANPESISAWDDILIPICEQGCRVDFKTTGIDPNVVLPWVGGDGDYLKINAINGFYDYDDGEKTKFKRKITINTSLAPYVMKVLVQVSWDEKANFLSPGYQAGNCNESNCIEVEDTLYNWYNYTSSQNEDEE